MSRKFTMVSPAFWRSRRVAKQNNAARVLLLYLLTCDHQNNAGCYRLPAAYAMSDLGWPQDVYDAALAALVNDDLIMTDEATSEVYIRRWFKHCAPTNAKHAKGVIANMYEIESDKLRKKIEDDFSETEWGAKSLVAPGKSPF